MKRSKASHLGAGIELDDWRHGLRGATSRKRHQGCQEGGGSGQTVTSQCCESATANCGECQTMDRASSIANFAGGRIADSVEAASSSSSSQGWETSASDVRAFGGKLGKRLRTYNGQVVELSDAQLKRLARHPGRPEHSSRPSDLQTQQPDRGDHRRANGAARLWLHGRRRRRGCGRFGCVRLA